MEETIAGLDLDPAFVELEGRRRVKWGAPASGKEDVGLLMGDGRAAIRTWHANGNLKASHARNST